MRGDCNNKSLRLKQKFGTDAKGGRHHGRSKP